MPGTPYSSTFGNLRLHSRDVDEMVNEWAQSHPHHPRVARPRIRPPTNSVQITTVCPYLSALAEVLAQALTGAAQLE